MNPNLTVIIPLWVCAFVCWLIAFLISALPARSPESPLASYMRGLNWIAFGLCFAASTHIWWRN